MRRVPGLKLTVGQRCAMRRNIEQVMVEENIPVGERAVFLARLLHQYPHWLPFYGPGDHMGTWVN